MNIALFPSAFHPSLGGVEELTRQLGLELQRRGHRVLILTQRWPRDLPAAETIDRLQVRRFAMRVPADSIKSKCTFALTHNWIQASINRALRSFKADVLHVQCVSSAVRYTLRAKKVLGVPLVVTLQGELTMDTAGIFKRPGFAQTMMRQALTESDRLTGCSARTLHDATEFLGGALPVPSSVVFNGANLQEAMSAEPARRPTRFILAMGRMVHEKGFDVLLRAIGSSLPPGWQLVLAGDGPLASAMIDQIDRDQLNNQVAVVGRADRKSALSLLKGCEFLVVPSRSAEGLPVVCAEAMAAGKAVIGSRIGGIPEAIIDGFNGILVPAEDVDSLAAAIRNLCADEPRRLEMGRAGFERSAAFSWTKVTADYEVIYKSFCRGS